MEYLEPKKDKRKSFYKKAKIYRDNNKIKLVSYYTDILEYDTNTKEITFLTHNEDHFTQTTIRHIKEFLYQFTEVCDLTRKEILTLAGV